MGEGGVLDRTLDQEDRDTIVVAFGLECCAWDEVLRILCQRLEYMWQRNERRTFDLRWSRSFFLYRGLRSADRVCSSHIWLCARAADGKTCEAGGRVEPLSMSSFTFFGGKLGRHVQLPSYLNMHLKVSEPTSVAGRTQ